MRIGPDNDMLKFAKEQKKKGTTKSICVTKIIFYFCENKYRKAISEPKLTHVTEKTHMTETNDYKTAHEEYNDYRCQWIHRTPNTE